MPNPELNDLVVAFGMPSEKAYEHLKSKGVEIKDTDYKKLDRFNYDESFTVAGVYDLEVLNDLKVQLEKAISLGLTKDEFIEKYKNSGFAFNQLNLVFDTNLRSSFLEGRKEQMRQTIKARPYVQRFAILDAKTTPQSRYMNEFVFKRDDKVYNEWLDVMNLYRDRDITITLTEDAFKKLNKPLKKGKNLVNKKIPGKPNKKGKRKKVALKNIPAFRHNPNGPTPFVPDLNKYDKDVTQEYQKYVGTK